MNIAVTLIQMIGGLVLLIYGMDLLSNNLKKIAGDKFESILKKATNNVFKGLFTGILITVALQSSTATTVMVVGFVNAGILKLKNSIPIIMGANIGTTITAQILRMANVGEDSLISLISPSNLSPIFLVIGILLLKNQKQKTRNLGQLLIGVGLLFTGLMTMVNLASTFSDLPILTTILTKLSNPILGVIAGAIITVIVQSSAAAVGILQALSTTGFTTFSNTIPVILGQNIGTCLTSLLSSIGATKNAKRTAAVHLFFNLIGTILFLVGIYAYQYIVGFAFWNDPIDMGGIANFHLIFNIVSTLILLPCTGLLEKLTIAVIKDGNNPQDEEESDKDYINLLNLLEDRLINIPSIALGRCMDVIIKMGQLSQKNLKKAVKLIDSGFDTKKLESIHEREDAIDKMDIKLEGYLVKIGSRDLNERDSRKVNSLLKIGSEFEKVGDYTYKIAKEVELMNENKVVFSQVADKELKVMYNFAESIVYKTLKVVIDRDINSIIEIEAMKDVSEKYREKYKSNHIKRLKAGKCTVENGVAFIEILASFEKVINHCLNIAVETANMAENSEHKTKHELVSMIYSNDEQTLNEYINKYNKEYELLEKDNKLIKI